PDAETDSGITFGIVLNPGRRSWMGYVVRKGWPFFVCLGLLLAAGLLRGRRRFGPRLADPMPERRRRVEHIEAVGRFFWQRGNTKVLLSETQQALMRALEHKNPELSSARGARRWELIAEMLNIELEQARR